MKILFNGTYKSLGSFDSEELGNFSVITGKNGSGKSQLVQCIKSSFDKSNPPQGFTLKFDPVIKVAFVENLPYKSSGRASRENVRNKLREISHNLVELEPAIKSFFDIMREQKIDVSDLPTAKDEDFGDVQKVQQITNSIFNARQYTGQRHLGASVVYQRMHKIISPYSSAFKAFSYVAGQKNKRISELQENDFFSIALPEQYIDTGDLLTSQVELIFYTYLERKHKNSIGNYRNEKFNESNIVISEQEFNERFIAPWVLINKILKENNVDLQINEYELPDYSEDMSIDLQFRKANLSNDIQLADLSDGEKIIIGLIIKLFTKEYYQGNIKLPELFVLDEPDAHLHPEMSRLLINVLEKTFAHDLGIQVIITTHSPSTVALAPEDSICQMSNAGGTCTLKKISKDDALLLLTENLPMLSIDYRNHRQVFVESGTDVFYFQRLFNKLHEHSALNYKLYFISNEKGRTNSVWVADIVNQLRTAGVQKAYGIIDWDGKKSSTPSVLVHGERTRYSIENFLLDPLYLTTILISMDAHNILTELRINPLDNHYDLEQYSPAQLQARVDWVMNRIKARFQTLLAEPTVQANYQNTLILRFPSWYFSMQGHELLEKIKEVFPALNRYRNEGELQDQLTLIMAKVYPVVPKESIDLLQHLCT